MYLYLGILAFIGFAAHIRATYTEKCSPVDTWLPKAHENCTKFQGCLQVSDRQVYLNPNTSSTPCGFLYKNDLVMVRDAFKANTDCRVVLYTVIFFAYDRIHNPPMKFADDVCLVLIVDLKTMSLSKDLLQNAFVDGSPWRVFILTRLPDPNPGKSVKIVKLLGPQLFPNAEWIMYNDAKVLIKSWPQEIFDGIDVQSTADGLIPLGVSVHPVTGRTPSNEAQATFARLTHINKQGKDDHFAENMDDLKEQMRVYKEEGFYDHETEGNVVDSYVLIYRNTNCLKRFMCAWFDECAMYSHREQVSHHYVQTRLKMRAVYFPVHALHKHFTPIGHIAK